MLLSLYNGDSLDISGETIHKYWVPQRLYNKTIFIMQEKFDQGYEGYAILTDNQKWVFFWRDTIEKHGKQEFKKGFFNNQPYIKISIDHADGHMIQ